MAGQSTAAAATTGLVLAGGRGSRMGGVDKGLVTYCGTPLALHAARRLQAQVGAVLVNANRHLPHYAGWGYRTVSDAVAPADHLPPYHGPLAGMLAGLEACETRWMLTVPCDSPRFPTDLAARMHAAVAGSHSARVAVAASRAADGSVCLEPVFCLMDTGLREPLSRHLAHGGRKVLEWARTCGCVHVVFDAPDDDPQAFSNANTRAELDAMERFADGIGS